MRRILLVTNIFPPIIGGPATFVDRLAHELARRGWTPTVVCSSEGKADPDDRERPFRVCRADISNRYVYEVAVRAILARELVRHRLVFLNLLETYFRSVNRFLGRRYVLRVGGDVVWELARNRGVTTLDLDAFQRVTPPTKELSGLAAQRRQWLLAAHSIAVPSRYLAGIVAGWGVPSDRIDIIPNGVEAELSATRPLDGREPGAPFRALFVGRLTNFKGIESLILALRGLDRVHVTVAGEGPELPLLDSLAGGLGLRNRVEFVGRLSRERVIAEMSAAHALVLPSLAEGMSHTLIEALALGLPCVASSVGGNGEVVTDGESGILVPPADPQALATALLRLRDDEALRTRLAEGARRASARFRLADRIDRWIELLERAAG